MNPHIRIAIIALLTLVSSAAGDPVSVPTRGPFLAFAHIPEEKAFEIRVAAADMLSRYAKFRNGKHLFKLAVGTDGHWIETDGLRLTSVTTEAVTVADKTNGIEGSYLVGVDSKMSRTYDEKTANWSKWQYGRNLYLPSAIKVVRNTSGGWAAHAPTRSNLVAFNSRGNPSLIPHGTKPVPRAQRAPDASRESTRHTYSSTTKTSRRPISCAWRGSPSVFS